ncbi:MAG TPA: hypothetical protein VF653_06965 [Methylomirabilota bacterium]
MIGLAEDIRDIAGWPAIEWGMTEEEVREALEGRVGPITPVARFANSYAPLKGALSIEDHPFEVLPQFSLETGELCQVVFRGGDADADRLDRIMEVLTACYGPPVERGTRRTWRGSGAEVELDTVTTPSQGEQLWLRWYPVDDGQGG